MRLSTSRSAWLFGVLMVVNCGTSDSPSGASDAVTPMDEGVSVPDAAPPSDVPQAADVTPVTDTLVSDQDTAQPTPDVSVKPDMASPTDVAPDDTSIAVDTAVAPSLPLQPGVSSITITQAIEGVDTERPVLVHAPHFMLKDAQYPVVLFLHGAGGKGQSWVGKAMSDVDAGLYVGVYPDGHLKKWNTGYQETKADDIAFVGMIIERLQEYQQLDLDRMFVVGSSNGAALAHDLAIKTDHFVGITTIVTALTEDSQPNAATQPVSVLQILGKKDNLCKYEGGKAPMGMTFLHAEDSAAVWAAHNGCSTPPETTTTAEGNTRIEYSGCTDGVRVLHYGITEAAHGMPPTTEGGLFPLFWAFFESLP